MSQKMSQSIESFDQATPLLDQSQISGGFKVVADLTARNALPLSMRNVGMVVSFPNTNIIQKYIGANVTDVNWTNPSNWVDPGGAAAADSQVLDYKEFPMIETQLAYWNALCLTTSSASSMAYHYSGNFNRIYFVLFNGITNANNATRAGQSTGTYVSFYDIDKKGFSKLIAIPQLYPNSTDFHDVPSMIVSDNGYIIIMKEALNGPSGSHNSPIQIWRSNSPEVIESPSVPGTHDFTLVTTISAIDMSYPTIVKGTTSGEILVVARANSGGHHLLVGFRSLNNGLNWQSLSGVANSVTTIASCLNISGSGLDWYFYPMACKGTKAFGYHIWGLLNEGPSGTSPDGTAAASRQKYIMHFYSPDGITWSNAYFYNHGSGGFSKNVVSSGAITPAELLANFIVSSLAAEARASHAGYEAIIDKNGIPYILSNKFYRYNTSETPDYARKDNVLIGYKMYNYNITTDLWVETDITTITKYPNDPNSTINSAFGSRPNFLVYGDGVYDVVCRRVYATLDTYNPIITIESAAEGMIGGIFRVVATAVNNFGEGIVAGDYFDYLSAATIDGSNILQPLKFDICFFRTYDNGTTFMQIRPPLVYEASRFAGYNSGISIIHNVHDTGYGGFFFSLPKNLPAVNILDHSDIILTFNKFNFL